MPSFFVIPVSPRIAFELLFETIHEKSLLKVVIKFSMAVLNIARSIYLNKLIYKPAIMSDVITS